QPSVAEIAKAAGVSRTTFYRAFPSRAGLLQALDMEPEPGARERVLEVALRLLRTRTLDDLSMDELAVEAGISRANLYRLFPGKAALFRAMLMAAGRLRRMHPMLAVQSLVGGVMLHVLVGPLLSQAMVGGPTGEDAVAQFANLWLRGMRPETAG